MADECDQAQARMEFEEEFRRRATKQPEPLPPCGICYYCKEDVPPALKFCDSYCRDDFEFEQRMKERNGKC